MVSADEIFMCFHSDSFCFFRFHSLGIIAEIDTDGSGTVDFDGM